jgi:hypothetical protein
MINHQDSVAEPLHVAHVVSRQQQGGPMSGSLLDEELTQPLLGEHVQTEVGSSRMTSLGECRSAAATSPHIRWPGES